MKVVRAAARNSRRPVRRAGPFGIRSRMGVSVRERYQKNDASRDSGRPQSVAPGVWAYSLHRRVPPASCLHVPRLISGGAQRHGAVVCRELVAGSACGLPRCVGQFGRAGRSTDLPLFSANPLRLVARFWCEIVTLLFFSSHGLRHDPGRGDAGGAAGTFVPSGSAHRGLPRRRSS